MSNLDQLRALADEAAASGATLKNIQLDEQDGHLMLPVVDPGASFEVSIPAEMQLPTDKIDMETGVLVEDSGLEAEQHDWFTRYLRALVSEEQRAALVDLRSGIDAAGLHEDETFKGLALNNFITIDTSPAAINRALLSRHLVGTKNGPVLLPVLGAGRHSMEGATLSMSAGGSFRATGKAEGEVSIVAGRFDALHGTNTFSQLQSFRTAFSIPLALSLPENRQLIVSRALSDTVVVGKTLLPRTAEKDRTITMAYTPVGMSANPAAPREVFRAALKPFNVPRVDEIWSRVKLYNNTRLFKAYVASQSLEHAELRKMLSGSLATQIETALESI